MTNRDDLSRYMRTHKSGAVFFAALETAALAMQAAVIEQAA